MLTSESYRVGSIVIHTMLLVFFSFLHCGVNQDRLFKINHRKPMGKVNTEDLGPISQRVGTSPKLRLVLGDIKNLRLVLS